MNTTSNKQLLQKAIFGSKKTSLKEQDASMLTLPGQEQSQASSGPSTTVFVVVRMSQDGIGAPVGVYSDSSRAEAARDIVEPAQVYELTLNAEPEAD
jgi:hypothetical protein